MNKPSWFQPLDLIPLLFAAGCAIFAFAHGFESEHQTQASILLVAAPALMWLIWGYGIWLRRKYINKCTWYPKYGCMIDDEGGKYLLPTEHEWDTFLDSVVRSWAPHHPAAERILRGKVKWIHFRQHMDEKPINPNWGIAKGITVAGGSVLYVDYNQRVDAIERTALAHELGHVIHGLATGGWNQAEHHVFTKKHHLR